MSGRFHNHFHNPLKPWSEAGLHALRHQPSSIRWMQDPAQSPGGNWTWQRARELYLQALTAPDARAREEAAADMFRALGQIMHLVVDASVPEHTRADAHPLGTLLREALRRRRAGNYEYWVSDQHTRSSDTETAAAEGEFRARYLSSPIGFDPAMFTIPLPSGETRARVPVARLIDADKYQGDSPDPNVTLGGAIGLAEFANANFFSEDTFDGQFPFPRREDLVPNPRVAPTGAKVRAYLAKPAGHGLPTGVALAECVSERSIARWIVSRPSPYPCVDEAVWEETATHMLPRAVGYARGVLDYFFRGNLEYAAIYSRSIGTSAPGIFIDVINRSDETLSGSFALYHRYDAGSPGERRQRVATVTNNAIITIAPGARAAIPLTLDPVSRAVADLIVVFRGRLGAEDDAVAARVFSAPTVFLLQEKAESDFRRECSTAQVPAPGQPIFSFARHTVTCRFIPFNRRASGQIGTTAMGRAPLPQLAQITAFSQNTTGGLVRLVPLTLDGVTYTNGIWQRTGNEPDPTTFMVHDAQAYPDRSELLLSMSFIGGGTLVTGLVEFGITTALHNKTYQGSGSGLLVRSERTVTVDLVYNRSRSGRPFFIPVSISGFPYPYADVQGRVFAGATFIEGVRVNEVAGFNKAIFTETVFDHFEQFPTFNATPPKNLYVSIGPMIAPHPSGPSWTWSALARRQYDPHELAFMEAFGLEHIGERQIVVTGREAE